MKQLSQKRANQKLAKELKRERKKANKAQEEKKLQELENDPRIRSKPSGLLQEKPELWTIPRLEYDRGLATLL